jgi:hypothetical protein
MFGHKWFLRLGELADSSILGLIHDANELVHCSYSLHQGVDHKGQAQADVSIGEIILLYDGLPTQEIINWAISSVSFQDGALVLCDTDNAPVNKVFFKDGACVGMSINYISEGTSPVLTQLIIHPREISFGDIAISKSWLNMPEDLAAIYGKKSDVKPVIRLAQPTGKTTLRLVVEDREYEVERFRMDVSQSVDHKGQPLENMHGGIVSFSISGVPDGFLNKWMIDSGALRDGMFRFEKGDESSPLKVKFTEAYCIDMRLKTLPKMGTSTDFVISANELDFNGKWLYNNFKL